MANVVGTAIADTIHRAGDGRPVLNHEIVGVTTGVDTIFGDNGNDTIYGDAGADTIDGGEDQDTIYGGAGADILKGGTGNDVFRFLAASDIDGLTESIDGGLDNDTIDLSDLSAPVNLSLATIVGVERLLVNNQTITITAAQLGAFSEILASGNIDRFFLSAAGTVDLSNANIFGIDEFRGTSGIDTFNFSGVENGQTINTLGGTDTVYGSKGADNISLGSEADTANGGGGADFISGDEGVDLINGEDGNDVITGGADADKLSGGTGNDTFRLAFVSDISGLAETIDGGADVNRLDFQTLNATGAADLTKATLTNVQELYLNGNDITLTAAQLGAFTTFVASGNADRLIISAAGTADLTDAVFIGIDEIRGSSGADVIKLTNVLASLFIDGRQGADTITGGYGNDTILGDIGTDTINGGDGNDEIRGGQDADILSGGVGYDSFVIQQVSDISNLAEKIDGGNDVDRLDFAQLNAFGAVNLTKATITSVEQLTLNQNDVTLTSPQLGAFEIINSSGNLEKTVHFRRRSRRPHQRIDHGYR